LVSIVDVSHTHHHQSPPDAERQAVARRERERSETKEGGYGKQVEHERPDVPCNGRVERDREGYN